MRTEQNSAEHPLEGNFFFVHSRIRTCWLAMNVFFSDMREKKRTTERERERCTASSMF